MRLQGFVLASSVLYLGSVGRLDVGVRLVLWLSQVFVVKTFEGVLHVRQHGQVDLASRVVPIDVHAKVSGAAPVVGDGIVFL